METVDEVSVDIDIYGRAFDGVFGPGAEKVSKRNALYALKARRDFSQLNTGNEYIDYDLYGRADPRIFGPNAHVINAQCAAEHAKQPRSRKFGKKSLKAILFPFGKVRGWTRYLKRKFSKEEAPVTEGNENPQLEPIDDTQQLVNSKLPTEEAETFVASATVAPTATSFDSGNKAIKLERSVSESTYPSQPTGFYSSIDFDNVGIASVPEVSSPEVSDVDTSSNSSQSDESLCKLFAKVQEESAQRWRMTGEELLTNGENQSSSTPMMPDRECTERSPTEAYRAEDAFGILDQDIPKAAVLTDDSGSASTTSGSSTNESPNASSNSASSSSSIGIEAVHVTEDEFSGYHSNSLEQHVHSQKDASSGDSGSGSFPRQNSESASRSSVLPLANQDTDASISNRRASLADLFHSGSDESSQSLVAMTEPTDDVDRNEDLPNAIVTNSRGSDLRVTVSKPSDVVISEPPDDVQRNESLPNAIVTNSRGSENADEMEINSKPSVNKQSAINPNRSADAEDMDNDPKRSGIEMADVNRRESTRLDHMDHHLEAVRNSSFAFDTETEVPPNDANILEKDGYIAEGATPAEHDSDDSDEEFFDALDGTEDSGHSMAAPSSSEVVSSSVYSTLQDSDELESSEQTSGEFSQSTKGSSTGLSKNGSGSHDSASTGKSQGPSGSLHDSSTSGSQVLNGSLHNSSKSSKPHQASPPVSSAAASKHSSDRTESSFYSQVFESTVVDEDDNSDVFLMALTTPHEEPQL